MGYANKKFCGTGTEKSKKPGKQICQGDKIGCDAGSYDWETVENHPDVYDGTGAKGGSRKMQCIKIYSGRNICRFQKDREKHSGMLKTGAYCTDSHECALHKQDGTYPATRLDQLPEAS